MLSALPGLGARCFNGARARRRAWARAGVPLLDLDARNLDFACLVNCFLHVVGELDGVEERLGFFLVKVDVPNHDIDASRVDVGKEVGISAAVVLARSGEPCSTVVLDGVAILPLERSGVPFGLLCKGLFGRHLLLPNGDETVDCGVLVFGEGELDPVGILAGGVAYADALGHLDLKPDKVGLLGDGGLFLALALGGAAAARCAPAAADKGKRGKEGDAEGKDR